MGSVAISAVPMRGQTCLDFVRKLFSNVFSTSICMAMLCVRPMPADAYAFDRDLAFL